MRKTKGFVLAVTETGFSATKTIDNYVLRYDFPREGIPLNTGTPVRREFTDRQGADFDSVLFAGAFPACDTLPQFVDAFMTWLRDNH